MAVACLNSSDPFRGGGGHYFWPLVSAQQATLAAVLGHKLDLDPGKTYKDIFNCASSHLAGGNPAECLSPHKDISVWLYCIERVSA